MKRFLKLILKIMILFCFGGLTYVLIELIFRGFSHWTMMILGGLSFVLVGLFNEIKPDTPIEIQMIEGGLLITILEFLTGLLVNIKLNMNIWDYSDIKFNLMGQICLPFSLLWVCISGLIIYIDDLLRWKLFKEPVPKHLHIFED